PPALVVSEAKGDTITITKVGSGDLRASRPPIKGDYAFLEPAKVSAPALIAWGIIPNMHFFWLLDAVSQNQRIPPSHLLLVLGYASSVCALAGERSVRAARGCAGRPGAPARVVGVRRARARAAPERGRLGGGNPTPAPVPAPLGRAHGLHRGGGRPHDPANAPP